MVLDDFEQKERERLRSSWEEDKSTFPFSESESVPLWAREEEWGNDCLVTVQSSKWGEFLGVMEGSDRMSIPFPTYSIWNVILIPQRNCSFF